MKDQNQSKGRGNPGGSQSGGTGKKENAEQLKGQARQDKEKRKDNKGNFIENSSKDAH